MKLSAIEKKVEIVRTQLGFNYSFVINSKGLRGGIVVLWRGDYILELEPYTKSHISLRITHSLAGYEWILIGFSGNSLTSRRIESWKLLRVVKHPHGMTWLCVGDFNEILHQEEKYGASMRPYIQMEDFKLAWEDSGLSDSSYVGDMFTWSNDREGEQFTKERLDHAFSNSRWQDLFPFYSVNYEMAQSSDHRPIVVTMASQMNIMSRGEKPFIYEANWAVREECLHWKKPMPASHKMAIATKGL